MITSLLSLLKNAAALVLAVTALFYVLAFWLPSDQAAELAGYLTASATLLWLLLTSFGPLATGLLCLIARTKTPDHQPSKRRRLPG